MTANNSNRALVQLRRARRRNRLAEMEWFEVLYRAYVTAFVGGGGLLFIAGFIDDSPASSAAVADVRRYGPALLGLGAAAALAMGLRSGSRGGPLGVEEADVRHLLLAPISRAAVLRRPAVQRLRSVVFTAALAGGAAGLLAGRRLPGTGTSWVLAGAVYGTACGALWVASALLAHAVALPRWAASVGAASVLAWQVAAAVRGGRPPGPGDTAGSLALWGLRVHAVDIAFLVVVAVAVVAGLALVARTRLEALASRSALVGQLRFAATMQDLRTVLLLRRQLAHEYTKATPWIRLGRSGRGGTRSTRRVVWRRDWRGLVRFPLQRVIRLVVLAGLAGAALAVTFRGTTPAVVVAGLALFLLGTELLEPLSQEIDQPDHTDGYPVARGDVFARHLAAPAAAAVPFAVVGVGGAFAVRPEASTLAVAAILALPTAWGAMSGAAVAMMREIEVPKPISLDAGVTMVPPEFAGPITLLKVLLPLALSVVACMSVVVVRHAVANGDSAVASAIRMAVLPLLVAAGTAAWVQRRDAFWRRFHGMMEEGRQAPRKVA